MSAARIGSAPCPERGLSRLSVPALSEVSFEQLRLERLERLQSSLRRHGLPVCLLYNPANIRYATGVALMDVWAATTFSRHCLVPAEGEPILFEYGGAVEQSRRLVDDVRPMAYWQFEGVRAHEVARRWAAEVRSALRELGLEGEPLAVDKLDTPGWLALQDEGIRILDVSPATVDAREVKTAQEIELCKINGAIGDAMLAAFEAAIRPGVREYELLAVLADTLLRHQGETVFSRLVASGTNTNPWLREASDKIVMPGDVVAVDTDANGYEGYVIDVSRTFLCGDRPTPGPAGRLPRGPRVRGRDGRARPSGTELRGALLRGSQAAREVPAAALLLPGAPGGARRRGAVRPVSRGRRVGRPRRSGP